MTTPQFDEPTAVPTTAAVETMPAIVHDKYGTMPEGVLRLAMVAKPTIAAGEFLVRVHAASVDRGTWHVMAGLPYPIRVAGFGLRTPKYLNPGRNFAGTVEAVGTDVTGFQPGDDVFGISAGAFATYARVRPDKLARMPANISFDQAAPSRSPGSPPCRPCATTDGSRPARPC